MNTITTTLLVAGTILGVSALAFAGCALIARIVLGQ